MAYLNRQRPSHTCSAPMCRWQWNVLPLTHTKWHAAGSQKLSPTLLHTAPKTGRKCVGAQSPVSISSHLAGSAAWSGCIAIMGHHAPPSLRKRSTWHASHTPPAARRTSSTEEHCTWQACLPRFKFVSHQPSTINHQCQSESKAAHAGCAKVEFPASRTGLLVCKSCM